MKSVGFSLLCTGAWALNSEHAEMATRIQNTPGVLWTAGIVERFMNEPIKPMKGVTEEAMAERSRFAAQYNKSVIAVALPDRFDSEEQWPHCAKAIGDIRDQGHCGCCWAFAAAGAASDRVCIATKGSILRPFSAQDICFCSGFESWMGGCNGGDLRSPWYHMKFEFLIGGPGAVSGGQFQGTGPFGSGLCSDYSLPHCPPISQCPAISGSPSCPTKCDSTAKAPHNDFAGDKIGFTGELLVLSGEQHIAQAILEGGSVETAFSVYADFMNYKGGIYHYVTGDKLGGHAVRMVGWGVENGTKYWKIANSWNHFWGEKGFFRIRRGTNECGIEDEITAASATAQWGKKSELLNDVVV